MILCERLWQINRYKDVDCRIISTPMTWITSETRIQRAGNDLESGLNSKQWAVLYTKVFKTEGLHSRISSGERACALCLLF